MLAQPAGPMLMNVKDRRIAASAPPDLIVGPDGGIYPGR
jgi:hypothetical protein